jgi:Uma2 family endonuclease
MNRITLTIPNLTGKDFLKLCEANRDLRLERTATGEVIIMPPTTPWTGKKNGEVYGQLWLWNRQTGLGKTFDSSTGFTLPNGAVKSPDATWVSNERWNALSEEEQKEFSQLSPDFVIELRSKNDTLKELQEKMSEYIDNGVRLGWLIDPKTQKVEIYKPGQDVVVLDSPTTISGDDVLPEFVLDLTQVW